MDVDMDGKFHIHGNPEYTARRRQCDRLCFLSNFQSGHLASITVIVGLQGEIERCRYMQCVGRSAQQQQWQQQQPVGRSRYVVASSTNDYDVVGVAA